MHDPGARIPVRDCPSPDATAPRGQSGLRTVAGRHYNASIAEATSEWPAAANFARKEKTIRRTNDEHIHVDAQIFPTPAALCAIDRFLPRDGGSARKRPRALWQSTFAGGLHRKRPGRI